MIELLAPAGDLEKLKIAYLYGADACFIGGEEFSLRARASNFSLKDIEEGAKFAHSLGKKLYVTTNIIPHNENLTDLITYLEGLEKARVDAIIVASPYIASVARKYTNLEIHISTQQSTTNKYAFQFYQDLGATRIVLARELSLTEIKEITANTSLEIEVFIHGGMCSSYSGRCTLSNTFTLRDANRGGCAHSCRWLYDLYDEEEKISTDILFSMGSKDLQTVFLIPDLIQANVQSLKIEGRMKSVHYIATVVNAYRMLIDEYQEKGDIEDFQFYENEISKAENRLASQGFLNSFPTNLDQLYNRKLEIPNQMFVGIVLENINNLVKVEQRNNFRVGDEIEIFGPSKKPMSFTLKKLFNANLEEIEVARHPKEVVYLEIPFKVNSFDMLRKK